MARLDRLRGKALPEPQAARRGGPPTLKRLESDQNSMVAL